MNFQDIGFNFRLLKKNAGFNFLCVIVIALGLCVSVVDYYLVAATSFQDMPFANGDKFSLLRTANARSRGIPLESGWDTYRYNAIKENAQSYSELGAMELNSVGVVSDGETSETVDTARVTSNLLGITGIQPLLGRGFTVDDERAGAEAVALIGHSLWLDYYGGRADIIGSSVRINGEPRTVVGVMPEGFKFPVSHDLWLPLQLGGSVQPEEAGNLYIAGLLSAEAGFDTASVELQNILAQLAVQFPDIYKVDTSDVKPYAVLRNGGVEAITNSMLAAMVIIILLSCLNVGNLLLVRTNERHNELLIRAAVGASRWQLIKQVLIESLLICIIGGLVGIALIYVVMEFISSYFYASSFLSSMPFWIQPKLDVGLLFMALCIVLVIWLLAGGIPAWKMSKVDPGQVQGGGSKGVIQGSGSRVTNILIGTELVASIFFLILSGVLVLGIAQVNKTDLGANTENLLTARVNLPEIDYPTDNTKQQYFDNFRTEIQNLAGVTTASYVSSLPGQSGTFSPYLLEGQDIAEEEELPGQFVVSVADNYFQTMDVELLQGRYFDSSDTANSQPVVIIDELFANTLVANLLVADSSELIGRRLRIDPEQESSWVTIVGINSHVVQSMPTFGNESLTTLYRPFTQRESSRAIFVAKTSGDPYEQVQNMRIAAASIDRDIPLDRIMSAEDLFADNMFGISLIGSLFVGLSSITLILAATGVYAIIARSVVQRTQETGIRRALGASNIEAVLIFVRKGLTYLLSATIVGGALAILASQGISIIFPNAFDLLPVVFIAVVLIFTLVIIVASYVPARKIVAMEPGEALHYE